MANRPPILCKLDKGKVIDAQQGFVDTFNWLVDFCNNLKGDWNRNATDQIVVCSVEWTGASSDPEHPYCFKISRGRLAVGDAASGNEGLLVIVPDPQLTQYISTTPHSTELAS